MLFTARTLVAAALVAAASMANADDGPKPIAVAIEPLGDRNGAVVARVSFRFANPREVTEAGLFLEGSFTQGGRVPLNFRYASRARATS